MARPIEPDEGFVVFGSPSRKKIQPDDGFVDIAPKQEIDEEPQEERGFFTNVKDLALEGGRKLTAGLPLAKDVVSGSFSEDAPKILFDEMTRRTYRPPELEQVESNLSGYGDEWDKADSVTGKVAVLGRMLYSVGKEAVTNPKGMAYLTAEQAANMAPPIAGMIAGAKLGLFGGPVAPATVPVGAFTGAVAGGMVPEMALEITGFVGDELDRRGLTPTEENIRTLLQDPDVSAEIISKTRKKAFGTASVDAALTLAGGKLAGRPLAVAQRTAKKTGQAVVAPKLAKTAGYGVAGGAVDVAGEGLSEASGQLAATGKVNMGEIALEMAGGLGGAFVEVPAAARALRSGVRKQNAPTEETTPPGTPPVSPAPEDTPDFAPTPENKTIALDTFRNEVLAGKLTLQDAITTKRQLERSMPDAADELNKIIIEAEGNNLFATKQAETATETTPDALGGTIEPETGQRAGAEEIVQPGATSQADIGDQTEKEVEQPVQGVAMPEEVPLDQIKLSRDVKQFKEGANAAGIVEGNEIKGEEYRRTPYNPIVLWRRKSGDLEVVTGRHRLDFAKRIGEKTIPAQILNESDGFSAQDALTFDAEQNILDNQGSEYDYANYFRNTKIDEGTARARGLLRGKKESAAFLLGKSATDQTFDAFFRQRDLGFRKAAAIAKAAPNNERLQVAGRTFAYKNPHANDVEIENFVHAISLAKESPKQEQGDLFGFDDSAIQTAELQAKKAAAIMNRLRRDSANINAAIRGDGKLELSKEGAKEYGIKNPKSKEQLKAAREKIQNEISKWEKWYVDPELVKQLADLPGAETVTAPSEPPAAPAIETPAKGLTYDQFSTAYRQAWDNSNKYNLDEVGHGIYVDEMAKLADENPEYLERLEAEEEAKAIEGQAAKASEAVIDTLNPTSGVFTNHTPQERMAMKLGDNITTLDKTMEKAPGEEITVYRGAEGQDEIKPGDFVTTSEKLAKDYAGTGKVLSKKVKLSDVLDDKTEPLGEEYIYRPTEKPEPHRGRAVEAKPKVEKPAIEPLGVEDKVNAFVAKLNPMQKGRVLQTLNSKIRYNDVVMTVKEEVEKHLAEGYVPTTKEFVDEKALEKAREERRAIYSDGNQNIKAKRVKELDEIISNPPQKTSYRLTNEDGTFDEIGKTAYDYAKFIMPGEKKADAEIKKPRTEKTEAGEQATIPGASAVETFDLTNPETEISKPLPQQVTPKNEDLFTGEEKAAEGKTVNTEDVGVELTYNKRNRINTGVKWDDIKDKNAALKVKEATKQNVYPKPDYRQMIDDGMEPLIAHIVKQVYDAIPIKPQLRSIPTDEQLQKYITGVNRIMDGALQWANDKDALAAWATKEARYAGAALGKVTNLTDIAKPVKSMLDTVYPEGYKNYLDEIRILGGNATLKALQPGYDQLKKAVKEIKTGWPVPQESWQKQGYQIISGNNLKADYYSGKDVKSDKPYTYAYVMTVDSYDINRNLERRKFDGIETKDDPAVQGYVKDRLAALKDKQILVDRRYNLIGAYDSLEEARGAAREKVKRENKPTINEKGISVQAAQRTGAARRESGENISSDKLRDTFGFKGINFGNWLKGDTNEVERQLHLNHSYDSFMDLAEILNVPPQALSLNGMLGVAIGAQGSGRHAAHFVPGVNEINLTRTAGAGAVAHEWGHALDHYFATQAGLEGSKRPYLTEHKGPFESGLRPEIADLFNKIITAMNKKTVDITPEEQIAQVATRKEEARKRIDGWLRSIKGDFARVGIDETAFDAQAERIKNLDLGDGKISVSDGFSMSPVVSELRNLYKEKTGRTYSLDQIKGLQSNINHYEYLSEKETQEHIPQRREVSTDYAKEAAGLDKGKSKSYWNTNVEKFARAFDAFITDTIEENAAKNTYLSGIEAAPPKGEERIAINKAFRELVDEIKTKETDKGVAMYSVNQELPVDQKGQGDIIKPEGDQNERERFTSDNQAARSKRDSILPEVHQERERRVGVEREVISQDVKSPNILRKACRDGQGLVYHPEGYDIPAYTEVKALADVYGIEVIPVIDTTGFINAFIRDGAIFLNVDTGNMDMIPAQIAAHEISHHRKDTPEGKATRRKIDVRSRAFIQYRRELSRLNFGEKEFRDGALISRLDIIEEFAADLEAGIKQHYGVTLSEGLFPDSQITTIQERIEKGKAAAGKDVTRGPPEEDKGEYSIREQQDPPVSDDPKVLNRYLKDETDAIATTIMNKLRPKNMTWLETILKSPEWFGHPQINKIVKLFMRDRNELYHINFNNLNLADDIDAPENTVAEAGKMLKGKGLSLVDRIAGKESAEYKMLTRFVDYFDTSAKRNPNKSNAENMADCVDYMKRKGATDDVTRVWKLYRQSYDLALDLQTRQVREMINQVIEQAAFRGETPDLTELKSTLKYALAEMEKWKGYYAPRVREVGDWKVQAYKKHGPLEANREYYREHRGSELSAQRLGKKLAREGWKVYSISKVERLPEAVYQDVKAAAAAKLIDAALEKYDGESNLVKINSEVLRAVADEIRARGFRSHMMHRKEGTVIRGYIEDPIKRHLLYTNQLAGGLSKAYVARKAFEALLGEKFQGEQYGGIDPLEDPKAYQVATDYIEEQLRNMDASDRLIGLAKSITTFKFLGFNIRSLAVNITAIVTTAPAAIHQYAMGGHGSLTRVIKELGFAGKDFGAFMAGRKLANSDEQAFLEEMHKKGWDDAQYTRDALGVMNKTHSKIWPTMMAGSMYLFGQSEKWNRGTTVLAAYRLARKQGDAHVVAAEKAHDASDKAHGVYGKATLPMWAQGSNPAAKVGQMMYVYGKFSHNYLQMLYDLGFKKHNIKGAMFAFLSPLVLAGGAALPFKDVIFGVAGSILKSLFGDDRDPEKWVWDEIRKHLGAEAEAVGRHGLTGAAGVDISGSLSIGVGVPKNLMDLSGAIGGMIEDVSEIVPNIQRGQPGKALEAALPTGLANPFRAVRERTEGASTRANRRVWDERGKPFVPTVGETISRSLGFRSTRQAVLSERTWEGHREQAEFAEKRKAIYEEYRGWLLGGKDDDKHKKIIRRVREFNDQIKDLPHGEVSRITFESMRSQAKGMQKPTKKERAILTN